MLIFMSHSAQDDEFVDNLRSELLARDYQIWVDHYDIPVGKLWDEVVDEKLGESDLLMLILSPASVSSENVGVEWREFKKLNKFILPVKIKECPVPLLIRHLQFVDFTNPEQYESSLTKLLNQLARLQQNPKATNKISPVELDETEMERITIKQEIGSLKETIETLVGRNQILLTFPKLSKTRIIDVNKEKFFMGRGVDADIDLSDYNAVESGISRQHAVLTHTKSGFTLTDLGSTNGTYVERQRLAAHVPAPLKNRALIRLGTLAMQVFFNEQKSE